MHALTFSALLNLLNLDLPRNALPLLAITVSWLAVCVVLALPARYLMFFAIAVAAIS